MLDVIVAAIQFLIRKVVMFFFKKQGFLTYYFVGDAVA